MWNIYYDKIFTISTAFDIEETRFKTVIFWRAETFVGYIMLRIQEDLGWCVEPIQGDVTQCHIFRVGHVDGSEEK